MAAGGPWLFGIGGNDPALAAVISDAFVFLDSCVSQRLKDNKNTDSLAKERIFLVRRCYRNKDEEFKYSFEGHLSI